MICSEPFAQQVNKKGLFLVYPVEAKGESAQRDVRMSVYISVLLKASLYNSFEGYLPPSADLTNLWRIEGENVPKVNSIQIRGSYQHFKNWYSFRFQVTRNAISTNYFFETREDQLISNLKKMLLKISPNAKPNVLDLFPSPKAFFQNILSLEAERLNSQGLFNISEYRKLLPETINLKTPEPFLLLAVPLSVAVQAQNFPGRLGIYSEVELIAQNFLQQFPEKSELHSLIALLNYLRNKNYDLMEKYSRSALKENVNDDVALLILALSLGLNTGEAKVQTEYLNSFHFWLSNENGVSVSAPAYLAGEFTGIFKDEEKQLLDLIAQIDEEKKTKNPDFDMKFVEAKSLIQLGETEKGKELLKEMIQKYPQKKEPVLLLSDVYISEQEHIKNISLLRGATTLEEEYKKRIGNSYFALKDWKATVKYYDEYLKIYEEDIDVLEKFAIVFINLELPDRAEEYLDRAVQIEPNNSELWRHKGEIALRRNLKQQAKFFWERSLALDPQNEKTRNRLNETR